MLDSKLKVTRKYAICMRFYAFIFISNNNKIKYFIFFTTPTHTHIRAHGNQFKRHTIRIHNTNFMYFFKPYRTINNNTCLCDGKCFLFVCVCMCIVWPKRDQHHLQMLCKQTRNIVWHKINAVMHLFIESIKKLIFRLSVDNSFVFPSTLIYTVAFLTALPGISRSKIHIKTFHMAIVLAFLQYSMHLSTFFFVNFLNASQPIKLIWQEIGKAGG